MMATEAPPSRARGAVIWRHSAVALLFCVLTVVMLFPIARDLSGRTIGWEGDNTFYIRQFWWMKHALVDLRVSPFLDRSTFYPAGHEVANGELSPANTIPAVPLTMAGGPVLAYNVTLLFTFAMTAFGTYLWVLSLTGSIPGSILAGIIAGFLPYRFAHVVGHLPMVSTQWVPFALYAFERFLRRKTLLGGVALGIFVALVALSSWYYAYAIALMLPLYALVRSWPWRERWDADWWRGLAVAGIAAAVLTMPFALPYMQLRSQGGLVRDLAMMESWSINFYDFFLPNRLNPAFAAFVLKWFPREGALWVECGVALGYTALALALVAVAARRRNGAMAALLVVWIVSYAIALGPTLHSGDRQVLLPVPLPVVALAAKVLGLFGSLEPARAELLARQSLAIPLPSMFMFVFVPMTSGMRCMSRFGMWTGLMTAGLAGWGTAVVLEALRRRAVSRRVAGNVLAVVLVAGLGALVLAESYSRNPTIALRPRDVDLWLARQGEAAITEMPVDQALRPFQDYYKTVHGQPTVFGPIGDSFYPPFFAQRKAVLSDFPSDRSLAWLRSWHVRYVLLTPPNIPDWPALKLQVNAQPALRFDREIGGVLVYEVR
jgi:hypothetical protein